MFLWRGCYDKLRFILILEGLGFVLAPFASKDYDLCYLGSLTCLLLDLDEYFEIDED